MKGSIDNKISAVVCSCKTVDQLNVAHRYAKLARKGGHIGQHRYHLIWGVIIALKGVLRKANSPIT